MSTSTIEMRAASAQDVRVTEDALEVDLSDGRSVSAPLACIPGWFTDRGGAGSLALIGNGEGIHWPDLDEDVSVENILSGRPSARAPDRSNGGSKAERGPDHRMTQFGTCAGFGLQEPADLPLHPKQDGPAESGRWQDLARTIASRFIGMADGLPADGSANLDHYLYGAPKT